VNLSRTGQGQSVCNSANLGFNAWPQMSEHMAVISRTPSHQLEMYAQNDAYLTTSFWLGLAVNIDVQDPA
jgi:hypothetical protein